jgi:hypothetical protein
VTSHVAHGMKRHGVKQDTQGMPKVPELPRVHLKYQSLNNTQLFAEPYNCCFCGRSGAFFQEGQSAWNSELCFNKLPTTQDALEVTTYTTPHSKQTNIPTSCKVPATKEGAADSHCFLGISPEPSSPSAPSSKRVLLCSSQPGL